MAVARILLAVAMLVGALAAQGETSVARLPMAFVENRGQWDPSIRFMILHGRGRGWLTDRGFVAQLVESHPGAAGGHIDILSDDAGWYDGVNVAFTFEASNPCPQIEPSEELPGRYHFLINNDPGVWSRNVRSYSRVAFRAIYPGIDIEYYEKNGYLEYDIVLSPGADPARIVLLCEGAIALRQSGDGSVRVCTALGEVLHTAPHISGKHSNDQDRLHECRLELCGEKRIRFTLTGWDGRKTLRIDPGLVYGTYLGGAGTGDLLLDVEADPLGQLFVVGGARTGFPTTPGVFQEVYAGGVGDAVVTKLSDDAATLVYSTYLGTSNSSETAGGLAVLSSGEAVISGATASPSFPVTPGAYDTTHNGANDAWICQLSSDGSSLVFSTFLGGSGSETSANIELGPTGDIYLAGITPSIDFPTTTGSFAPSLQVFEDAFIARMTADGSGLVFSTYSGAVGGAQMSVSAAGLAVDAQGAVSIAGRVSGPGLPVTDGAFDLTHNGELDAYVIKLDASGSFVHYCTYFGDTRWEDARGIVLGEDGSAYIMGMTDSFNLPTTPEVFSTTLLGSDSAYIAKLTPDGSSLEYCTYAGGNCFNDPYGFAVDQAGYAYVGGRTCQSFPTTPDAVKQGTPGSPSDGFLLKLDPTSSFLAYSTLIGGDAGTFTPSDTVRAIALDGQGGVYLAGETFASDFPVTDGAFDTTMAGSGDGFVAKIDLGAWSNVGQGLVGSGGNEPFLSGAGSLQAGSSGSLTLYDGKPLSTAALVVGVATLGAPFKGGVMVPSPWLLLTLQTNASGGLTLGWPNWPIGLPGGFEVVVQYWITDPGGPAGFSASNGLVGVTPGP